MSQNFTSSLQAQLLKKKKKKIPSEFLKDSDVVKFLAAGKGAQTK